MRITFDTNMLWRTLSRFRPILKLRKKRDPVAMFHFKIVADTPLTGYALRIALFIPSAGVHLSTEMSLKSVGASALDSEMYVNADEVYKLLRAIPRKVPSGIQGIQWHPGEKTGCTFISGRNQSVFPITGAPPEIPFPNVADASLCHSVTWGLQSVYDAIAAVRYAVAKKVGDAPLGSLLFSAVDGADATDVVACNSSQLAIKRLPAGAPYSFLLALPLADALPKFFGKPELDKQHVSVAMSTPVADSFGDRQHGHRRVKLTAGDTVLYLAEGMPGDFPRYTHLIPQFSSGSPIRFKVRRDKLIEAIARLHVPPERLTDFVDAYVHGASGKRRLPLVPDTHVLQMLITSDTLYLWRRLKGVSPYESVSNVVEVPLTEVGYTPGCSVYEDTVSGIDASGYILRFDANLLLSSLRAQPEGDVLCWARLPSGPLCFSSATAIAGEVPHNKLSASDSKLDMLACIGG